MAGIRWGLWSRLSDRHIKPPARVKRKILRELRAYLSGLTYDEADALIVKATNGTYRLSEGKSLRELVLLESEDGRRLLMASYLRWLLDGYGAQDPALKSICSRLC